MTKMVKKSFDAPEEIRSFDKSKVEVVYLGDGEAIRVTNQPGWPLVGVCQTDCWDRQLLATSSMSSRGG